MKKLLRSIALGVVTLGASMTLSAQDANSIQGYYRVQNTGTGKYVEVRGPFTTAPDVTLDEAHTKAGTVMRLRAFSDWGGERYKIGNLSSQGIEVFGAPQEDYMGQLMDLAGQINKNDFLAAAYTLQRVGSEWGYIATGRMVVQALFQVVADRLNNEIASLPQDVKDKLGVTSSTSLTDFAQRFNEQVSANIDLHAYLEPVNEAEGTYRLYFNWIDCKGVSEFYLANDQNKKEFELGFECMRQYMSGKAGLGSGETIDAAEAALWKTWGYDLDLKYSDCYNPETQIYTLTYEKIFADHEVLYNWLKMYIERFLDPAKAPDASILGINFKDFAAEMQRHEIMQGFLKYIPSIQENQKLYLVSGRYSDGVNEYSTVGTASDNALKFGLLAEEQANAAGDAAIWKLCPVKSDTDNYFAITTMGKRINKFELDDAHFTAMYVDFPMQVISDKMTVRALDEPNLQHTVKTNLGDIDYVELEGATVTTVPRRTCVLFQLPADAEDTDYIVEIPWQTQDSDYDPTVGDKPQEDVSGLPITDEEVSTQHAPAMRAAATGYYGVLLSTPADATSLQNRLGLDADMTSHSVYSLTTRQNKESAESGREGQIISTPWYSETEVVPANHAFILAPKTDIAGQTRAEQGISLEAPEDEKPEIVTGIDNVEAVDSMQPDVIYDLQGRRVNHVTPGQIYILNGKKILVK